jgi:hypothetical protein
VTASAVSALGRLIIVPVTTTSWIGVLSSALAGACCATEGLPMATMHTHANKIIVIRFTRGVTPIGFRILIFASLELSSRWRRVCKCETFPLYRRDKQYKRTPL